MLWELAGTGAPNPFPEPAINGNFHTERKHLGARIIFVILVSHANTTHERGKITSDFVKNSEQEKKPCGDAITCYGVARNASLAAITLRAANVDKRRSVTKPVTP